jgi:hypothetical protein
MLRFAAHCRIFNSSSRLTPHPEPHTVPAIHGTRGGDGKSMPYPFTTLPVIIRLPIKNITRRQFLVSTLPLFAAVCSPSANGADETAKPIIDIWPN